MMVDDELRRLLRVPLQAFGDQEAPSVQSPHQSGVALRVRRLRAAGAMDTVRVSLSTVHDIAQFLHHTHARYLEDAPRQKPQAWSEPGDWHSRALRRMLRRWTPQSYLDIAVHPANLTFLAQDEELVVSGQAPADDLGYLEAKLLAPLSADAASHVLAGLATHLGLAELRGAARYLNQKRPQPTAPRKLPAAPHRPPNLRPSLHRNRVKVAP